MRIFPFNINTILGEFDSTKSNPIVVSIWQKKHQQSGRSPKVVALFSATNFSSNIIELLQLNDTIQIKWNYA